MLTATNTGPEWQDRISAICLSAPYHELHELQPREFASFISTRCRAYLLSEKPLDQPVPGGIQFGCSCYSSGEPLNAESIMPSAWMAMLKWLSMLHMNRDYEEVEVVFSDDTDGENAHAEDTSSNAADIGA